MRYFTQLLICATLFWSLSLNANEQNNPDDKFICSSFFAFRLVPKVNLPSAGDKFKHCGISCMLTLRCGALDAFSLGLIKELADLFGAGHAEWEDILANREGVRLVTQGVCHSDDECLEQCQNIYPW